MSTAAVALVVLGCLLAAVLLGRALRRALPESHLSADTKDVVKLAMGLVATMSALVLGLLVSSAKSAYDTKQSEVIQMAAKTAFLDRVLLVYGPEAARTRAQFHEAVKEAVQRIWPQATASAADLIPNLQEGNRLYRDIQALSPHDEEQKGLKAEATSLATQLGEIRSLLVAQSVPSVSTPLLIILVFWLFVILLSFTLFAPPNTTALFAVIVSAIAVAGAVFLILELDQPFGGLIRISSEPMLNAINQLEK